MKMKKGFTLIELLVVIAIIGVLSTVVIASLNEARSKGGNATVKSNLANIRPQAELIFTVDTDYDRVCGVNGETQDTVIASMLSQAAAAGGGAALCGAPGAGSATDWAATVPLKIAENGNGYWCVDSHGASHGVTAAIGVNDTICP